MKKTWSDYFEPFAKIGNIDFHYLTEHRGSRHIGLVVDGKQWSVVISATGKSVKVFKN